MELALRAALVLELKLELELELEKANPAAARRGRRPRSESVGWQNFGKMLLVFGCIGSDFCKKICVLQHFSKSTRFSS